MFLQRGVNSQQNSFMEDKFCYKFNTKRTHYANEISALSETGNPFAVYRLGAGTSGFIFPFYTVKTQQNKIHKTPRKKKWFLKRLKHEHTRESPLTTASSHLLQSPEHIQIAPYGSQGRLLDSVSYRQNCM